MPLDPHPNSPLQRLILNYIWHIFSALTFSLVKVTRLVEGNVTHAHAFPPLLRLETRAIRNFAGALIFERFGPLRALWGKC